MSDGHVTGIEPRFRNRATQLIEDFMVAANGVIARLLRDHSVASIRRVVKTPERWDAHRGTGRRSTATICRPIRIPAR